MLRAIREIKPRYVVGENVSGLLSWNGGLVFNEVQVDLENEGYEVQPVVLPACAVGGWHRRDRVWFVAHAIDSTDSTNSGQKGKEKGISSEHRATGCAGELAGTNSGLYTNDRGERAKRSFEETIPKLEGLQRSEDGGIYAIIEGRPDLSTPVLCRGYDGIPAGVDRVTAYGNAIVPQVAYIIFRAIVETQKKFWRISNSLMMAETKATQEKTTP